MDTAYHKIKSWLKTKKADGVLISRNDSFLGEYYPPESGRLAEVTGFTGSAGLAFLSAETDVLFVDSRYTLQARAQSGFQVFEVPTDTTPTQWLAKHFSGKTVWYNPLVHSIAWVRQTADALKKENITLKALETGLIDSFFKARAFLQTDTFEYGTQFAGESASSKLERLKRHIIKQGWDAYLINAPENISWLLNKRAKTVPCYPVVFERGFVDKQGRYFPLTDETIKHLAGKRVALSETQTPAFVYDMIKREAKSIVPAPDALDYWKAQKNDIEIQNIRLACLYESAVICRFLAWVEQNKKTADELACDSKLVELRRQNALYIGDSFDTIAAVGEHAARAHYQADKHSNAKLLSAPLLLVDTGGHYLNGTTDMTRTIAVGTPTDFMKRRYTQVLQGHIDLARSSLRQGESTAVLDMKAHAWLKKDKATFLHATGHGIGLMLAVHEMPPVISPYDRFGLKHNMIVSNEPAFYSAADGFGIRLENMLLAQEAKSGKIVLENLIFAPFDHRLVLFERLTAPQKAWLKQYHQTIFDKIFPLLTKEEQDILIPFIEAFTQAKD